MLRARTLSIIVTTGTTLIDASLEPLIYVIAIWIDECVLSEIVELADYRKGGPESGGCESTPTISSRMMKPSGSLFENRRIEKDDFQAMVDFIVHLYPLKNDQKSVEQDEPKWLRLPIISRIPIFVNGPLKAHVVDLHRQALSCAEQKTGLQEIGDRLVGFLDAGCCAEYSEDEPKEIHCCEVQVHE
ncbi:uncharacterized protein LY89DRAFT_668177 [Mollisia scopiformis]|uniref:Uncharacterized protein n=1 Tax=Mollisia scopiformis TaxID=149040 RepID=A0A194XCS5_MOLSC|nr:uncharacterized protein LY89DRAFT_668177 [Mollisia scopiformis]KUJ17973.1 hypothetical protein LY89DRAFT_668177 [Mollisia scopiformis]